MTHCWRHSAILFLLTLNGCALLNVSREIASKPTQTLRPDQIAEFENDAPVRRIVRLQTSVASALADDRRLRGLAWEELDESGLMSPEDRLRLNQSGIRVGVAGSAIPWELSSLLQGRQVARTSSRTEDRRTGSHTSAMGAHVALPEGSTSIVEIPAADGSLFVPAGEIAGLKSGAELKDARLVLELSAAEYGDGWVVIRFLPQIHHGTVTTRYSISGSGEQLPTRQKIQPLYEQQFEVKLHNEETVVIGYQQRPEWTIGRMFFQSETLSSHKEYLVALQLTGIEEVTGQKSMTVNYSRY